MFRNYLIIALHAISKRQKLFSLLKYLWSVALGLASAILIFL